MNRRDFQKRLLSLSILSLLLIRPARSVAIAPTADGRLPYARAAVLLAPDDSDDVEGLDADGLPLDMTAPDDGVDPDATDGAHFNVVLEQGVASDDVLRMQLRLSELGYRLAPSSGISDAVDERALQALALQNPSLTSALPNAALFDATVGAAPLPGAAAEAEGAATPNIYATGLPLPWSDVRQRLVPDETYALTICTSGIVFRMRYLEGENHAEMAPELAWDDATLQNQLGAQGSSDKLPVVLTMGGLHIAASIAMTPFAAADENGMHRYCLYFTDSRSHLCNIVDAEHQRIIALATQA